MSFFTFTLRRSALRPAFCGTISVCCALALGGHLLASDVTVRKGKELFEHRWEPHDPLSRFGDGLGPMFNARSCVECHNQAGIGGGGGNENNVVLLTLVERDLSDKTVASHLEGGVLELIHPGFKSSSNVVIHRYSTSVEYANLRSNLLGLSESPHLQYGSGSNLHDLKVRLGKLKGHDTITFGPFIMQRIERSTPALFGDALIDKIEAAAIEKIAGQQPDAMRGTFRGRFGWHGQTRDLSEFVQGACANELGLEVTKHEQPLDPTKSARRSKKIDMTKVQVAALTDFVASLPPPHPYIPETPDSPDMLRRGSLLFESARCAVCHVSELGNVKGIYSDVLLHDMGDSLADPPGIRLPSSSPRSGSGEGYYGDIQFARTWRTPPLWGVRNSAPYLHDGRAETIDEAIRMHDGQGKPAADAYTALKPTEREDVVTFVKSLGAP